jgi:hypothetical protein
MTRATVYWGYARPDPGCRRVPEISMRETSPGQARSAPDGRMVELSTRQMRTIPDQALAGERIADGGVGGKQRMAAVFKTVDAMQAIDRIDRK